MTLNLIPIFITEELDLLSAFNKKQEDLISDFITNIDKHIDKYEVEEWISQHADDEGHFVTYEVEHIAGISEEDYVIRGEFTKTMPMYQRQSMLLTLWGAFESELENICYEVGRLSDSSYEVPRNINVDGNKVSTLRKLLIELEKRGVPMNPPDKYSQSVETLESEVREIRNAWAHDGGKYKKDRLDVDGIEGITITRRSQLDISPWYIEKVINLMKIVANEISESAWPLFHAHNNSSA